MKPIKKTKEDIFEERFGYRFPSGKTQNVQEPSTNTSFILGAIILPFFIIAKILKFTILGPSCTWTANPAYMALSGIFMLFSSIVALFFIRDIALFIQSLEFIGSFATAINGLLVIFFLVQLVRGSNFISHANAAVAPPGSTISNKSTPNDYQGGGRTYSEIDEFKGYVNSRMGWMSNSDKEKYIKELFGGKKN
jgi:hypothetical protein